MTGRRLPGPERARIGFSFDGAALTGLAGDTIGSALLAAGIRRLRTTATGEPRGMWCGMGVCWECMVDVAGEGNVRACMTELQDGMVIHSLAGTEPLKA